MVDQGSPEIPYVDKTARQPQLVTAEQSTSERFLGKKGNVMDGWTIAGTIIGIAVIALVGAYLAGKFDKK